jgi:hypothetical protein
MSDCGPTLPTWALHQIGGYLGYTGRAGNVIAKAALVEWPGGLSPPDSPRTVREPLDSYGSRCSAVSMTQLPVSEELRICTTQLRKPVPRPLGLVAQPFELPTRPADDIDVGPLQGRTQLRPIEVAVGGCRVGEDVSTLAPHRPERALLTHSVPRARDSFCQV